jgi:hypothetical protein
MKTETLILWSMLLGSTYSLFAAGDPQGVIVESHSPVEQHVNSSVANQKSLLERCRLGLEGLGAGAISLICGGCLIKSGNNLISTFQNPSYKLVTIYNTDTFVQKMAKSFFYVNCGAIFAYLLMNTGKHSLESLSAAARGVQ